MLAAVNGGEPDGEAPPAYIEAMDANLTRNWAPLTGIVSDGHKLIDLPRPELYDLTADPAEQSNLFDRLPQRARTLEARLREARSGFTGRGSSAQKTTLSADARQRLQALGYVASSADPSRRVYTNADDPKTLIGPANELQHAVEAFNRGERPAAMAAVRTILQQHPDFATPYGILASMLRQTGDLKGAIATLEELVRKGIADPNVMVVLAGYLAEAGSPDKAIQLLEAIVADRPDYAEAYNSLGVIEMQRGHHDRARAAFRRLIELDPTSARAYENLAADEIASGDRAAAIPDLQQALALDPRLYDALYNLGLVLESLGRHDEARPHLERFIREAPRARYATDIARIETLLQKKSGSEARPR
jgi:tetratricopeptide (TPR) repeat protein